jgi:hypothetical protein
MLVTANFIKVHSTTGGCADARLPSNDEEGLLAPRSKIGQTMALGSSAIANLQVRDRYLSCQFVAKGALGPYHDIVISYCAASAIWSHSTRRHITEKSNRMMTVGDMSLERSSYLVTLARLQHASGGYIISTAIKRTNIPQAFV